MVSSTMNIEITINELVLEGFPEMDRGDIAAAVEGELVRMISERGLPSSLSTGGAIRQLDGGSFTGQPGASAATIGAQVALALYGGSG